MSGLISPARKRSAKPAVLGSLAAALVIIVAVPAHAEPCQPLDLQCTTDEVVDVVEDTVDDPVGTVDDVVDDTTETVDGVVEGTRDTVDDTVGGDPPGDDPGGVVPPPVTGDDPADGPHGDRGPDGRETGRPERGRPERGRPGRAGSIDVATPARPELTSERAPRGTGAEVLTASRNAPVDRPSPLTIGLARIAFPLLLVAAAVAFVLLQGRVDSRDPKLAHSPVEPEHEMVAFR